MPKSTKNRPQGPAQRASYLSHAQQEHLTTKNEAEITYITLKQEINF